MGLLVPCEEPGFPLCSGGAERTTEVCLQCGVRGDAQPRPGGLWFLLWRPLLFPLEIRPEPEGSFLCRALCWHSLAEELCSECTGPLRLWGTQVVVLVAVVVPAQGTVVSLRLLELGEVAVP